MCPPFLDEEGENPDIKMARKLKEVVLHPVAIEKTNVRLADSLFHESTIAALDYYASHGHPEFDQPAQQVAQHPQSCAAVDCQFQQRRCFD